VLLDFEVVLLLNTPAGVGLDAGGVLLLDFAPVITLDAPTAVLAMVVPDEGNAVLLDFA